MCSVGHKGKFGHEFMEFEFKPDGRLRYANNSNYKNDVMIRKEGASQCRLLDHDMPRGSQHITDHRGSATRSSTSYFFQSSSLLQHA